MSNTLSNIRTLFGRKTVISAALVAGAVGGTVAMTQPASASTANWSAIAQHESSGNWHTNTGNGFGGGLQISPTTSASFGGPSTAAGIAALPASSQIALAEKILVAQGPGAWPNTYVSGGSSSTAVPHSTATAHSGSTAAARVSHTPVRTHAITSGAVKHTAVTHTAVKHAAVKHAAVKTTIAQRPLLTTALAGVYRTDAAAWQKQMACHGFDIVVDGHYGPASAKVAVDFQKSRSLLVDGIVGARTWDATFR